MGTNGSESKLAVAGSLGLILAIAGVVLTQQQLKSSRPLENPNVMQESVRERSVPARLWEDPLEAVERDKGKSVGWGDPVSHTDAMAPIRNRLREQQIEAKESEKSRTDILIAITTGGPYEEGKEGRLRDRYAIGSALGVACYVPDDEGQLSYVKWKVGGRDRPIPYEWYRTRKTRQCPGNSDRADHVLVFWVTGEIVQDHPLRKLRQLLGSLFCEKSDWSQDNCIISSTLNSSSRVKVIGPRSSSDLRDWLADAVRDDSAPFRVPFRSYYDGMIDLYSPWATAMPSLLITQLNGGSDSNGNPCQSPEICEERLIEILRNAGINLKYHIGSDDQLLMALVEELERRQVKFEKDAVVLIGEWDTYYGRALPIEFRAAVCHHIASEKDRYQDVKNRTDIDAHCDTLEKAVQLQVSNEQRYQQIGLNIWRYSYLRGLDGQVPGHKEGESQANNGRSEKGESKKKVPLLEDRFLERPVGTSQFDYIRRLADQITYEMKREGTKVRAVGIRGTDQYDALLILQALRDRFPTAIFFVTDLDARLVYSDEYRWTRNVVIASHFGLTLNDELQRDIPPFRSSYQTSAFFATLQAVGHVRALNSCLAEENSTKTVSCYKADLTEKSFNALEKARLYEVGRHGPVDISVVKVRKGYESLHSRRLDLKEGTKNSITPDIKQLHVWVRFGVLLILGLVLSYGGTRRWIQTISLKLTVLLLVLGAIAFYFGMDWVVQKIYQQLNDWGLNHDEGEPSYLYWFEGVSIWPTEILRCFTGMLALLLVVKGYFDLSWNKKEIEVHLLFSEDSGGRKTVQEVAASWLTKAGWDRRLMRCKETGLESWLMVLGRPTQDAREKMDVSWKLYLEAGSVIPLLLRVTAIYIVIRYGLIKGLVFPSFGELDWTAPCRGVFSCRTNMWVMQEWLIPASTLLTAFALDQAMLCCRWIGVLSSATKGWPHPTSDQEGHINKVRLVANRTAVVNRIIVYPPLICLLIIIARNPFFDNWRFPHHLIAVWTINMALALLPAFMVYWAAEKMRRQVLDDLNYELHRQLSWGKSAEKDTAHTREAIKDVESIKKGAFLPLWQQPFVQTLLYGAVGLLQYLYLGTWGP